MSKPLDKKALGRGLGSLLPSRPPAGLSEFAKQPEAQPSEPSPAATPASVASPETSPLKLPISLIDPNPLQPRTIFQEARLNELADSIRANGLIQPIIVRRKADRFELIAGERRWRAARMADLTEVPVVIQELADEKLLEVSLIENIQREDLNPIEVAIAYDRLAREHHLSHEEIGRRTGKDRATITNMIRLLKLPAELQLLLAEHRLSMGHARALLGISDPDFQRQLGDQAAAQGLSVREVERAVQKFNEPRDLAGNDEKEPPKVDPNVKAAAEELERVLGTRVRILEKSPKRGRIEIDYFSQDDLSRIYDLIVGETAG
ncbi:MAG: ParB/RepB/Spo0J family partition protein [Acidobacteria bacterium]|nr:ParB/RepB/Spo0J family partition protein [Acidobacteriota bacterium]